MNPTKYLFIFLLLFCFSNQSFSQITLKESNPLSIPKKYIEIKADAPQKSIKLLKGQKLKINNFGNQEKVEIILSDAYGNILMQEEIFAFHPLSSNIDFNIGTYFLSVNMNEKNAQKSVLVINNY